MRHKKLTEKERDALARWKAERISNKECARRLGRHPSTIGRELERNSVETDDGDLYAAIYAQARTKERRYRSAHSKKPLKNSAVYDYVTGQLREGWSPDQIAGRLKIDNPDDRHWRIATETIYRWIYQKEQRVDHWYEYLRRKQKKRKKRSGRKVHRSRIPDRVSIRERDEAINQRQVFGHWEGDTVEGKGRKVSLHTEVECVSRFILARKVPAITSEAAITAQKQMFGALPKPARRSTTLDNGRENHLHAQLRSLGMKTYFADPYSAWQRGTNEHGNWHLRYYFPKGTDFSKVSDEEIQDVVEEVNGRPRKILSYKTANEIFTDSLEKGMGVAISY